MKFNTQKLPKRWLPAMFIIGLVLFALVGTYVFFIGKDTSPANVQMQSLAGIGIEGGIGGTGTEKINSLITIENEEKAEEAKQSGSSHIPIPLPEKQEAVMNEVKIPEILKPTIKEESMELAYLSSNENTTKQSNISNVSIVPIDTTNLIRYMSTLKNNELGISPKIFSYKFAEETLPEPQVPTEEAQLILPVGEILYAINDLPINSDVTGTPVVATVIHGSFKGAKLMGNFARQEKRLVITFNKIVFNGTTQSFTGYAVDAEEAKAGVASNVNSHLFLNWASFVAASFLEGFGTAVSTQTKVFGNQNYLMEERNFSLQEQTEIAAGKVGERVATQLEKNFDRPPTVHLNQGTPIGVLIIN